VLYFEWFAQLIFKYVPRFNYVKHCWLLKELPLNVLKYLNIPSNDIGIDLVIKTKYKEYYAVQVKYRSDINNDINWKNLSTFVGLIYLFKNKLFYYIFKE
jgi:predicted helicase